MLVTLMNLQMKLVAAYNVITVLGTLNEILDGQEVHPSGKGVLPRKVLALVVLKPSVIFPFQILEGAWILLDGFETRFLLGFL